MVSETRYFRTNQVTVNGLNCFVLGNSQSASIKRSPTMEDSHVGVRVWKRASDGTETEITSGIPVAQVTVPLASSMLSNTWACPLTSLASTDTIVVRVYCDQTGSWINIGTDEIPTKQCEYQTEQLGASSLDSATWTVYYQFTLSVGIIYFRFGSSAANSRITNFTYSVGVVVPKGYMDGFVLVS